jgi:RNA polymerase sigma-70 factor, ECF subfamily
MAGDPIQPAPPSPSSHDADDERDLELVRTIQRDGPSNTAAWTALVSRYQHRLYAVCLRLVSNREAAADLTQDAFVKIIQGLAGYDGRSKLSTWMIRITMNTCLSHLRAQKHRKHASLDSLMDSFGEPTRPIPKESRQEKAGSNTNKERSGEVSPPAVQSSGAVADSKPPQDGGHLLVFTGPGGAGTGNRTGDWREQTREHSPDEGVSHDERRRLVASALASLPADQRAILVLRDVQDLDYEQIAQAMDLAVGTVKSRLFRARLALREAIEAAEAGGVASSTKRASPLPIVSTPPTDFRLIDSSSTTRR